MPDIKATDEVKQILLAELSKYVAINFTTINRWNEEKLYLTSFSINKSDSELWEGARTTFKENDFFLIRNVLLVFFRKSKFVLTDYIGKDDSRALQELLSNSILEYERQKLDEFLTK